MRGIILAAGKGSRLNGTAGDGPKCLVRLGGLTLIERQIQRLRDAGITEITAVVGCQAERVRQVCGHGIAYIENARYAETNSLYSLWMARTLLMDGFVVLNCDVLFHPQLLADLLTARHEAAALVAYREPDAAPYGPEEMKVKVRSGRVVDMSKTMDPAEADAENVGLLRFDRTTAPALVAALDAFVERGGHREWAPRAFAAFAQTYPLHAVGTRGFPWTEIDFPEDYEYARREVLPALDSDERPGATGSWPAVGAASR